MLLQIQDLNLLRDDTIIIGSINFNLASGQALLVTGSNGVGKTTLLRTICGIYRNAKGKITFSENGSKLKIQQHVHYLSNKIPFYPELSLIDNLYFYYKIYHKEFTFNKAKKEIDNILKILNLKAIKDKYFYQLSSSQQKRSCFANLLLASRPLWLLDEPYLHLDQCSSKILSDIIKHHLKNSGLLILVSHLTILHDDIANLNKLDLNKYLKFNNAA